MKIVAIKRFTDKVTKDIYSPGDVISHFSDERVEVAVKDGLALIVVDKVQKENSGITGQSGTTETVDQTVKVEADKTVKEDKALKTKDEGAGQTTNNDTTGQAAKSDVDATLTEIDMSQQWQKVIALVKVFGDVEKLNGYLAAENAAEKPRVSVIAALESRIAELSKKEE